MTLQLTLASVLALMTAVALSVVEGGTTVELTDEASLLWWPPSMSDGVELPLLLDALLPPLP